MLNRECTLLFVLNFGEMRGSRNFNGGLTTKKSDMGQFSSIILFVVL